MDAIDFVLTGDEKYIDQLLVTMTSIAINLNKWYRPNFHLFMKSVTPNQKTILESIKKVSNSKITIYDIDENEFGFDKINTKKFKNSYINIVCYYRLLMLKILPENVDKCFYVDGDMIVNCDVSDIWEDMKSTDIMSTVVEIHAMDKRETVLSHLYNWDEFSKFIESPLEYPYFNAGFFLLNIELAKKKKVWEKITEFIEKHPDPPYADQDILNAVIGQGRPGNVNFLPPHYNVFCDFNINYEQEFENNYYNKDEIKDSFKCAKILHYAGGNKPWGFHNCHYYDKWWEYASKSPASGRLLLKSQNEVKRLNIDLVNLKNQNIYVNKVQKLKMKIVRSLNKLDPIIIERYNHHTKHNLSHIKKMTILLKYTFEAILRTNSDHQVNIKQIKNKIDDHEIISFDIYDTLICRPFIHPTDVFRYIEQEYNINNFTSKRIEAENEARSKNNGEVTIEQIYAFIPEYEKIREIELEIEESCVFPNQIVKELYDYAIAKKKKIIIASDMYLPEQTITSILKRCDYSEYSKLYLSSKIKLMKDHGDMFDYIINDLNIQPNNILHIGDNLLSDYEVPIEKHIDAVRITKNIDALLESDCRMKKFIKRNNSLETSILLGILSTFRYDKMNYWEKFGLYFGGPVIYGYSKWILNQVKEDKIESLFLIARDGYTIKKALEIMDPYGLEKHYIYSPRTISNICNLNVKEKIEIDPIEANSTITYLINLYENEKTKSLNLKTNEEKINFILTHWSEFEEISKLKLEEYANYVNKITMKNKIGIVDLVTIYFSSQELISNSMPDKTINGYYWTIIENDINKNKKYENHTYQNERNFAIKDWDLMEFLITSPEAPIRNVTKTGDPKYKNQSKYDRVRSEKYNFVSNGELMFVKQFMELTKGLNIQINANTLNQFLNVLCDYPTLYDKIKIKKIKHPYDSDNTRYVPILKPWYK